MVKDAGRDLLLEKLHLGVFLNVNDGITLGGIFIIFILVYSFYSNMTICEYLKEKTLGKLLVGMFIVTFIASVLKNTSFMSAISSQYPQFLTILQIIDLLEILLITSVGVVVAYIIIYYLLIVIMVRWVIYCIVFAVGIMIVVNFGQLGNYISPNIPAYICIGSLVYAIYRSDDIQSGVKDYLYQLKDNLTCWFQK